MGVQPPVFVKETCFRDNSNLMFGARLNPAVDVELTVLPQEYNCVFERHFLFFTYHFHTSFSE